MTKGAIPALFIFLFGIWMALPDEISVGGMVLDALGESLCSGEQQDNVACQQLPLYKIMLRVIGGLVIIGDIWYIYSQFKSGNLF